MALIIGVYGVSAESSVMTKSESAGGVSASASGGGVKARYHQPGVKTAGDSMAKISVASISRARRGNVALSGSQASAKATSHAAAAC
jgi:hypothetical protein